MKQGRSLPEVLTELQRQNAERRPEVEGEAVKIMQVDEEIPDGLIDPVTGSKHADHVRILGVFVYFKYLQQ